MVADLLNSWFQPTRELALALAKERWNPKEPEEGLLLAMLSSELDEARQLGSEWLKELDSQWLDSASLLSAIAFLPHEEGRLAARDAIRGITLSPETKQDITSNIVSGLLALDAEDPLAGPAVDWLWQIVPNEISRLPDEHLLSLARHESEAAQLLSVRILLSREDLSTINEELLLSAVLSEHASVRKQGMSVLGKLNDTQLAQRTETLAACAVSNHLELREAATPLLARVTKSDPEAARQLAAKWYHLLFREEHFEGLHASLYETLTTAFAEQLDVIPKGQYHQMLDSSHAHGQMLGFFIMKQSGDTPSSDNLINWSNHALISVREWARSQFETSQLRQDPKAAIVLLESPYSDTRDWAFQICREEVQDGDWTPENLVAICDSCIEEVSAFGREQVTRLFSEEDGALYLAHLSQHPSTEMQIFATNYLERFASGHPERISDLDLYFRTILSRIGAGRIAKHRVLTFLEKEALADEATAQQVASLLAWQSGTVAIQDKAEMIRILYLIQNRWPKVENPLQPKTLPVFQAS